MKKVKADYPDQDSGGVRIGAAAHRVKRAPMPKPKPHAGKKHGPLRKK